MHGKRLLLLFGIFTLSLFTACTGCSDSSGDGHKTSQDDNNTVAEAMAENCEDDEEASDYVWDTSDEVEITLSGTSITVNGSGATVSGSRVTITSAGNYRITGTLNNGQVIVNAGSDDIVRCILDDVDITCSSSAPVYVINAGKTVIILEDATTNSITDGSSYTGLDDGDPNAAIFSKDYISFYGSGSGSLTVDGNYNDAIAGKDGLVINSGTISVTAVDDGIRGKDYLIIRSGTITVDAGGDGLKSDNDDDSTMGYILVESGDIDIDSTGDAFAAVTDALFVDGIIAITSGGAESAKGIKGLVSVIADGGDFTIDSDDDGIHSNDSIVLNGDYFTILSGDDGIHADCDITITDGEININDSYEGIESGIITVDNGDVSITASDDGFNATWGTRTEENDGSYLYLNNGNIHVDASDGDGLDSNGSIAIAGGTIIVHGPDSDPEVGMDYNGSCNISGGFLVMSGTNSNMTQGASTSSTQYSLKLIMTSGESAGTLFHIEDESGDDLVTFAPVRSYYSIVFSSPDLEEGSTYDIYTGGSYTGGTETYGLYEGGTYSLGSTGDLYTSFTVSSIVTSIGTGTGGGGGAPPPGK